MIRLSGNTDRTDRTENPIENAPGDETTPSPPSPSSPIVPRTGVPLATTTEVPPTVRHRTVPGAITGDGSDGSGGYYHCYGCHGNRCETHRENEENGATDDEDSIRETTTPPRGRDSDAAATTGPGHESICRGGNREDRSREDRSREDRNHEDRNREDRSHEDRSHEDRDREPRKPHHHHHGRDGAFRSGVEATPPPPASSSPVVAVPAPTTAVSSRATPIHPCRPETASVYEDLFFLPSGLLAKARETTTTTTTTTPPPRRAVAFPGAFVLSAKAAALVATAQQQTTETKTATANASPPPFLPPPKPAPARPLAEAPAGPAATTTPRRGAVVWGATERASETDAPGLVPGRAVREPRDGDTEDSPPPASLSSSLSSSSLFLLSSSLSSTSTSKKDHRRSVFLPFESTKHNAATGPGKAVGFAADERTTLSPRTTPPPTTARHKKTRTRTKEKGIVFAARGRNKTTAGRHAGVPGPNRRRRVAVDPPGGVSKSVRAAATGTTGDKRTPPPGREPERRDDEAHDEEDAAGSVARQAGAGPHKQRELPSGEQAAAGGGGEENRGGGTEDVRLEHDPHHREPDLSPLFRKLRNSLAQNQEQNESHQSKLRVQLLLHEQRKHRFGEAGKQKEQQHQGLRPEQRQAREQEELPSLLSSTSWASANQREDPPGNEATIDGIREG